LAFGARQLFWLLFQNLDNFFQSSSGRPVILFRKIFFVKVDRQSVKIAQADIAVRLRFLLLKEKELNCAFFILIGSSQIREGEDFLCQPNYASVFYCKNKLA